MCICGVEVRNVTANLSQTCGFAVAEHFLQFCGICGCGIECKFAVPSTDHLRRMIFIFNLIKTPACELYLYSATSFAAGTGFYPIFCSE